MMRFFQKLLGPSTEVGADNGLDERQLAAAALLVEAALADGVYAEVESTCIRGILERAFGVSAETARQLRDEAEDLAENAIDAHRFTKQVKTLPKPQRIAVIEGLYDLSVADGDRCKFEDAFIRHVSSLLHVDDVERAGARQAAEARHQSAD